MSKPQRDEPLNSIYDVVSAPRCTAIVAYTTEYVFEGLIHHAISERLLDVLNHHSIVDQSGLPREFLLMTEVQIFSPYGNQVSSVPSCLLNRAGTLLVLEKCLDQAEPLPAINFRSNLFTPKNPCWVNILLPGLALLGQIHILERQEPMWIVDSEQLFLPITNASLSSVSGELDFEFGAVNKSQIIVIGEASDQ